MNCNVVKDLIPLYIDGCCSEESKKIIEEHIKTCNSCKTLLEEMNTPQNVATELQTPLKLRKINDWKASVLQSVLLFISFGASKVILKLFIPASIFLISVFLNFLFHWFHHYITQRKLYSYLYLCPNIGRFS